MSEPNMYEQSIGSPADRSGRWFRRGRNIILILGGSRSGEEGELEFGFEDPYLKRVINPNIDVKAQKALIQMLKSGNVSDTVAAQTIIDWVDFSQLQGVFQPDQKVPALAARSIGIPWYEMLKGRRAKVFCDLTSSIPILIFRKDLDQSSLISVFRSLFRRDANPAFATCSISAGRFCTSPRCEASFTF